MRKLIYSVITSLDGYVNDATGDFQWAAPDEEVHAFVNERQRPFGTHLLGRRLYETMAVWDDPSIGDGEPPVVQDFAEIWRGADKVVFSTTLEDVSTARTRLVRTFDPAAVVALKAQATADLTIGGPTLAAPALTGGLVDELQQFVVPEVVGGGTPWLPSGLRLRLELVDERRFANGTVYLHHRVVT